MQPPLNTSTSYLTDISSSTCPKYSSLCFLLNQCICLPRPLPQLIAHPLFHHTNQKPSSQIPPVDFLSLVSNYHLHLPILLSTYFWAFFPPHHPSLGPHIFLPFLNQCDHLFIVFCLQSQIPQVYPTLIESNPSSLTYLHNLAPEQFPNFLCFFPASQFTLQI